MSQNIGQGKADGVGPINVCCFGPLILPPFCSQTFHTCSAALALSARGRGRSGSLPSGRNQAASVPPEDIGLRGIRKCETNRACPFLPFSFRLSSHQRKILEAGFHVQHGYCRRAPLYRWSDPPPRPPAPACHVFTKQPEGVVGGPQAGPEEGDHVGVTQLRRSRGGGRGGEKGCGVPVQDWLDVAGPPPPFSHQGHGLHLTPHPSHPYLTRDMASTSRRNVVSSLGFDTRTHLGRESGQCE